MEDKIINPEVVFSDKYMTCDEMDKTNGFC